MIYWSQEDHCFLAEVPEIPQLITDGRTRSEALTHAEEMISSDLAAAQEAGWTVPEPLGHLAFA